MIPMRRFAEGKEPIASAECRACSTAVACRPRPSRNWVPNTVSVSTEPLEVEKTPDSLDNLRQFLCWTVRGPVRLRAGPPVSFTFVRDKKTMSSTYSHVGAFLGLPRRRRRRRLCFALRRCGRDGRSRRTRFPRLLVRLLLPLLCDEVFATSRCRGAP